MNAWLGVRKRGDPIPERERWRGEVSRMGYARVPSSLDFGHYGCQDLRYGVPLVVRSVNVRYPGPQKKTVDRRKSIPSLVCTLTSFQKRFFIAVPGFVWLARRSCPCLRSSACRRLRSTRSPYCDAAGTGAAGGGPVAVIGSGVAVLGAVVCSERVSAASKADGTLRWHEQKSEEAAAGTVRVMIKMKQEKITT